MSQTVVLITGGNRGLGNGLVKRFLAQPNHTVVAANRDPERSTSKALAELPKGEGSTLIVAKYDAVVEQDAFDLVSELQRKHAVNRLDIVIPNAGIMKEYPLVKDVKRPGILEHLQVNTFGVVWLYQATRDLLQRSSREPIFAPIGSGAGSLGNQPPVPNAAYGPSKALVHWYSLKINLEDAWLNAFVLDPGFVLTDGGTEAAGSLGIPLEALTPLDDVSTGIINALSGATKEKVGGKVVSHTGEIQEW